MAEGEEDAAEEGGDEEDYLRDGDGFAVGDWHFCWFCGFREVF